VQLKYIKNGYCMLITVLYMSKLCSMYTWAAPSEVMNTE
jgi:hypothetical protein